MSYREEDRIAILATRGGSTDAILRALGTRFPEARFKAIYEPRASRVKLLRRRARKLGWGAAAGQAAFMVLVHPLLALLGRRRVTELKREIEEAYPRIPAVEVVDVPSVNHPSARAALAEYAPAAVVVSGTRIIAADTLAVVQAPFINMHAGITPAYRGVHGGYWALVEGKPDLVGTTIHLVNEGIDTGEVIQQVHFKPMAQDSFATYPLLHLQAGLPGLGEAVAAALDRRLAVVKAPDLPSRLRHHPTLTTYIRARLARGVR